jgi:hypothetical protein
MHQVMGEQVTTTATTQETLVTATQPGVSYRLPDLGGAGYVVAPHPPTPRDAEESSD